MKKSRFAAFYVLAGLCFAALVYTMAVVTDVVLAVVQGPQFHDNGHTAIERRRQEADNVEASRLRKAGFEPMIVPSDFDDEPPLNRLARKYGLAPLGPQPNARVYYCNEGYGLTTHVTDRFGFQNPDAEWEAEPKDIVIIGDSYAQGACVNDSASISGVLRETGRAVLSLASGGNGPIHYASLARTFLPVIKPRHVVLIFGANDNIDESRSIFTQLFDSLPAKYFAPRPNGRAIPDLAASMTALYVEARHIALEIADERYRAASAPLQAPASAGGTWSTLSGALKLRRIRRLLYEVRTRSRLGELPASSKLAIDETMRQCRTLRCSLTYVFIPNSDYWRRDRRATAYAKALNAYILQASNGGSHLLDLTPQIEPMGSAGYAPLGPHLSIAGYRRAADAIRARVASERQ